MIRLTSFLCVWFQCVCPLMPSCSTYHLTWVFLPWAWVCLQGCCSKAQPLLLTLDEGYLLTAAVPDLQCVIAPLGPPVPAQPLLLGLLLSAAGPGLRRGWLLPAAAPGLGLRVAPQGHRPWPWAQGGFSQPPLTSDTGWFLLAISAPSQPGTLGHCP